jgi:hypothetical protein
MINRDWGGKVDMIISERVNLSGIRSSYEANDLGPRRNSI